MKGLLLSLAVFLGYLATVLWLSRTRRAVRHAKLFAVCFLFWAPVYFLACALTPPDLGFLPPEWLAHPRWLDFAYGFFVLALNVHTHADFFFTVNGGFSTGLLLELDRNREAGLTLEEISSPYAREEGLDKIYAWRLPRLVATGYLVHDERSDRYGLTPKGKLAARLASAATTILRLGKGG